MDSRCFSTFHKLGLNPLLHRANRTLLTSVSSETLFLSFVDYHVVFSVIISSSQASVWQQRFSFNISFLVNDSVNYMLLVPLELIQSQAIMFPTPCITLKKFSLYHSRTPINYKYHQTQIGWFLSQNEIFSVILIFRSLHIYIFV